MMARLKGINPVTRSAPWMIAGAIWSAVTGMGLTYANPPASFEVEGAEDPCASERIRSEGVGDVLGQFAIIGRRVGNRPGCIRVVLFSHGHAWVGAWLTNRDFGHVTEPDVITVRKAAQAKEFIPVETTLLTQRPTCRI